ncbi:aromatic-L-amino-acid decarboxylase [Rhizoctonia solani]|uniref:Aromatic-L-amino-acid decarboxylase n=1 Tax=Rhizoctonia solani TaxID=456999 RepID=A0A8H8NZQ5_9AGAM|nr:aromatic-L-amino-acid decarboxylase [Rhizoctonia solani]QRW21306.1 aromatic-L-amino-acid decarboxylase [Rhizoctonia solani]
MNVEEFRRAAYAAVDAICDYQKSLEDLPVVAQVEPGNPLIGFFVTEEAPTKGESFDVIAKDFQEYIMPGITHWQHPSFFAYFPVANTFESVLADILAGSITNPGFNWACSPACTELEMLVMDWAAKLFGLDPTFYVDSKSGGGVLLTTASDSALTAAVAARARYTKAHPDVPLDKLVIYGTSQTHSLGAKAALILGLQFRAIEDKKAGMHPFIVIATVGTTSSGAIDNIEEVGQALTKYPDIWLHIDAAWAGVALACPEFREISYLGAINAYAHSFCTNFHKWGLVNFDCSTLWVRDRTLLTDALDVTPEFLRTKQADAGAVIDYRNWHLALGRRFRSLKVCFGVEGFQAHIRKGVELAKIFESLVEQSSLFEIVTPRSFALVVFRLRTPTALPTPAAATPIEGSGLSQEKELTAGASPDTTTTEARLRQSSQTKSNALNRAFYARISARKTILLTQTDLAGTFCIRMAIGTARTEEKHIREAFDLLVEEAQETLREWRD